MFPTRTAAFVCLFCCISAASYAAPVMYDFTAMLNSPIDGSNLVRGSFSFESGTPGVQVGTSVGLSSPFPATLNFASHSITSSTDPAANQALLVDLGSMDSFSHYAQFQDSGKLVVMNVNLVDPTGNAFGQSPFL